jgi:hypothetical protein
MIMRYERQPPASKLEAKVGSLKSHKTPPKIVILRGHEEYMTSNSVNHDFQALVDTERPSKSGDYY